MARFLLVGGGCRALPLVGDLVGDGHAARQVTRDEAKRERIEQAGAECWIGDPDRVGTLRYALDNVTLLLWLLGRVDEHPELNGSRLEMMLERTIDTTVRGIVVEDGGAARETTERVAGLSEIPYRILEAGGGEEWRRAARRAVDSLLV